jgi:hypothetical protein
MSQEQHDAMHEGKYNNDAKTEMAYDITMQRIILPITYKFFYLLTN